jgi:hypothetical protein
MGKHLNEVNHPRPSQGTPTVGACKVIDPFFRPAVIREKSPSLVFFPEKTTLAFHLFAIVEGTQEESNRIESELDTNDVVQRLDQALFNTGDQCMH